VPRPVLLQLPLPEANVPIVEVGIPVSVNPKLKPQKRHQEGASVLVVSHPLIPLKEKERGGEVLHPTHDGVNVPPRAEVFQLVPQKLGRVLPRPVRDEVLEDTLHLPLVESVPRPAEASFRVFDDGKD